MTEETPHGSAVVTADAGGQDPHTGMAGESVPHSGDAILGAAPQPAAETPPLVVNTMYIYAAVAGILGILVGFVVAVIAWGPAGRSSPYDLGTVLSNADGLAGHLVLTWDKKLAYRLVVEPSDPAHLAGFSQTVNNAPRPFSVDIQLKDSAGSVLCARTVLLKFDPRQAAALAASDGGAQAGTGDAAAVQGTQALDIAQSEAQELTREHGQDIFQNDLARDGQTESITAQGELPCSKQVFDRTASWSFSPNFLTLDQQAELQNHLSGINSDISTQSAESSAAGTPAIPRRKLKRKAPVTPTAFAIEGDDELVAFDFSKGTMETSGRRFFAIDKLSVGNSLAAWQDVPANIHYKCDLNSVCIIKRAGAGAVYARLRR